MKILLNEIQQSKLLEHTIEIIKFIKTINEKDEAVKSCFKMVQVPVRLSESIALNILKKHQLIEGCNDLSKFDFGKKRGSFDIEYGTNSIKIEVKATGTSKFQRFRPNSGYSGQNDQSSPDEIDHPHKTEPELLFSSLIAVTNL